MELNGVHSGWGMNQTQDIFFSIHNVYVNSSETRKNKHSMFISAEVLYGCKCSQFYVYFKKISSINIEIEGK